MAITVLIICPLSPGLIMLTGARLPRVSAHLHKKAARTNRKGSPRPKPLRLHKLPTTEPMSRLTNERKDVESMSMHRNVRLGFLIISFTGGPTKEVQ